MFDPGSGRAGPFRDQGPGDRGLSPPRAGAAGGQDGDKPGGPRQDESAGQGQDPLCGVRPRTFPPTAAGPVGTVLTGGGGLSPRCRPPPTQVQGPALAPAPAPRNPPSERAGAVDLPGRPLRESTPPPAPRRRERTPHAKHPPDRVSADQEGERAVAEGFEPSVSFPTLAFEASSFGRSDTLPRESLDHLGPGSEISSQSARKNAVSCAEHSSSRTPWTTSGRWLRRRSRTTSQSEPAAPAFSSRAP